MSEPTATDDPLEIELPSIPPGLRATIWQHTTRLLRRKLWLRRLKNAAALAACLLLGMGLMWLLQARPEPRIVVQHIEVPQKPSAQEQAKPSAETALALEWRAFDSADDRAALYLRAGHRYFDDHGDMQSALRCYRLAFEADPELTHGVDPNDNWLVLALKVARRKEISHASPVH